MGTTKQDVVQCAPVLLVSNRVKPDWTPSIALTTALGYKQVKFLLTPNVDDGKTLSLFTSFMPGSPQHGEADGRGSSLIKRWTYENGLEDIFYTYQTGRNGYQPDHSFRPTFTWTPCHVSLMAIQTQATCPTNAEILGRRC
jgi:hypothetical protein